MIVWCTLGGGGGGGQKARDSIITVSTLPANTMSGSGQFVNCYATVMECLCRIGWERGEEDKSPLLSHMKPACLDITAAPYASSIHIQLLVLGWVGVGGGERKARGAGSDF